ncbi:MmcQ/YjbR family DNA-binding protein [Prevotella dentasini]|uniref:MmcQ/YjbR family DNA-binding protein n=1 Tax=Prevotella dentasini TaxID=589537 RepID=UPI0004688114|nr:MmcQ/YjbR family DNA-binding protein [Prevotella dentasini]
MDIEQVRDFALALPGATEDMPYGPDWLVFRIGGKIFLHIWLEAPEPVCAVKLLPETGTALREQNEAVRPAYHLNKVHWNDLCLDHLGDDFVRELILQSYRTVRSKLPRRVRDLLEK